MYDLLLKGGCTLAGSADVGLKGGHVTVGDVSQEGASRVLNIDGLHILPGIIDTQVHFRDPGFPEKETLETGSKAAILGGITGVFDMPNTRPPTTTWEALIDKLERAQEHMWCSYAFYAGYDGHNLAFLEKAVRTPGCCGVKVFMGSSTGSLLVDDDAALKELLKTIEAPIAIHAEDEARLRERRHLTVGGQPQTHGVWRDAQTALAATQRIVRLAREVGRKGKLHILHVSTLDEIIFLAQNKDLVTFEVTPQHLTLTAPECYKALGTLAQMNPPIRERMHQDMLWEAVRTDLADVIGSDHAPHTLAEKARQYPNSPSGMPGVQTLVPIMLNHVHQGHLSLQRFVALTSTRVHRIFGLRDNGQSWTIVDLGRKETIEDDWLASQCGWSPFSGMNVTGWPVGTIINGELAMWEGEILSTPCGRPYVFDN